MALAPTFSVIVPTVGKPRELGLLLRSLEQQSLQALEVIVVDQSSCGEAASAITGHTWPFPVLYVPTPQERGASRARNVGYARSSGRLIVFADDDCWYPPWLLSRVQELFDGNGVHIIGGRAADEMGRSINGRFEEVPQPITRDNVWTTSIEWMIFLRREVMQPLNGFDETVGVGAHTPWQAAEGQDLVLRALATGFRAQFDPSLYGHHPWLNIERPDARMRRKGRAYGRGMGYVLRRHGYGVRDIAGWVMRPLSGTILYGLKGEGRRARYYLNVAWGRFEGWRGEAAPLA